MNPIIIRSRDFALVGRLREGYYLVNKVRNTFVLEVSMFDSLADRIRQDEHAEVNNTERIVRYLVIFVVTVLLFGGLYYGVKMLD